MSSKTKIVVLHMKEVIYTGIFAALGILLIVLLVILFLPGGSDSEASSDTEIEESSQEPPENTESSEEAMSSSLYIPGIYNTELVLNDQTINVEVIVDRESITSIQLVNLSEAVTTMYPLLTPTFEALTAQIYETQSLDNITYEQDSRYTSLVLLEAIQSALEKAQP